MPCQTHLRPPLGMMLFPHSGWRSQVRESLGSLSDTPWEADDLHSFFFPEPLLSYLPLPLFFFFPHCFSSSLSFPFLFSSKKHLSHSHRYSFSRSFTWPVARLQIQMQESWPHVPEMKKKKKRKRNIRNSDLCLSNKIKITLFTKV